MSRARSSCLSTPVATPEREAWEAELAAEDEANRAELDFDREWRERGAQLLPSGAIITAPGKNTAAFRERAAKFITGRSP